MRRSATRSRRASTSAKRSTNVASTSSPSWGSPAYRRRRAHTGRNSQLKTCEQSSTSKPSSSSANCNARRRYRRAWPSVSSAALHNRGCAGNDDDQQALRCQEPARLRQHRPGIRYVLQHIEQAHDARRMIDDGHAGQIAADRFERITVVRLADERRARVGDDRLVGRPPQPGRHDAVRATQIDEAALAGAPPLERPVDQGCLRPKPPVIGIGGREHGRPRIFRPLSHPWAAGSVACRLAGRAELSSCENCNCSTRRMRTTLRSIARPSRATRTFDSSSCRHSTATSWTGRARCRAIAMISTSHANPFSSENGRIARQRSVRATLAPHCVSTTPGTSMSCTTLLNVRPRNSRTRDWWRASREAASPRDAMARIGASAAASTSRRKSGSGVDRSRSQKPASGVTAVCSPARPRRPCPGVLVARPECTRRSRRRADETTRRLRRVPSSLPSSTNTSSLPEGCPAMNSASAGANVSKRRHSL